ncbi:MAG: AAA family ATPase [Huintestinicola sp.]|uniref:AAA family ATPase n=1 Tax=Huintestinicola sp. TaxID=2981661 RepID=UPI003F0DEBB4
MEHRAVSEEIRKLYDPCRTVIIGIDGLGGAGKSTVSECIKKTFAKTDIQITILHIDDFIQPRAVRYSDKAEEWECYYNLQWRYDYLIDEIIKPIRSGEPFHKKIELYDKDNDCYILSDTDIPVGSVVIIEGIFLQREELRDLFDFMIYIDVPEETRLKRVLERDGYIGDKEQIAAKYNSRYFPAERYYCEHCSPAENAQLVTR